MIRDEMIEHGDTLMRELRSLIDDALVPEMNLPDALENEIHDFADQVEQWELEFGDSPTPEKAIEISDALRAYYAPGGLFSRINELLAARGKK